MNDRHKTATDCSHVTSRLTPLDAYPLPKVDQVVEKIPSYAVLSTLDLKRPTNRHQSEEKTRCSSHSEPVEACPSFVKFLFMPSEGNRSNHRSVNFLRNIRLLRGEDKGQQRRDLSWFYAAAEKYNLTFDSSKNTVEVNIDQAFVARHLPQINQI